MAHSTTQGQDSFTATRLLVCVVLHGLLDGVSVFGAKKAIDSGKSDEAPRGCRPTTALKPERCSVPAKRGTVRNAEENGPQSQRQSTGGVRGPPSPHFDPPLTRTETGGRLARHKGCSLAGQSTPISEVLPGNDNTTYIDTRRHVHFVGPLHHSVAEQRGGTTG
ncbi:hypothetical protein B0T21DRAFT_343489 [Apiosordaria backusii]|uniref:Secreted protein n=1 Tax=Apiosordaria backusii TaxID=314023 RepID=A0AA40EYB5_9PEZI|nr:hypothetical protein B0T21DRAFT_343489 [Apiosordaria backusii]